MNTRLRIALLCVLLGVGIGAPSASAGPCPQRGGNGWSMTQLDLEVWVRPDEERLAMEGTVRLRLDALESSSGPDLLLNMSLTDAGEPVMYFTHVASPGADARILPALRSGSIRQAEIRFDRRKRRGDEITVRFAAASEGAVSQLTVRDEVALASWTAAWHPFSNPSATTGLSFNAAVLHAPGTTKLHLPADWVAIVDGSLVERHRGGTETVEVWETPDGIARGFAAGPYSVVTEEVGGREVSVYMLNEDKAIGPQRLVQLIADTMAAQEARLGPFPFDSYGVVEVPLRLPHQTWSAASQQTFILAKSDNFDHEHGNVPLWGHEMSHAWWGNTVCARGSGSLMCNEGLAGLGSLIAVETLEGSEALREYLAFSREGFSPVACAAGYFLLLRKGEDQPLSALTQAGMGDELADAKGVWVYHMLRQRVGDEVFFSVLRGVIEDFARRSVSLAEIRKRFVAAAPEHDLPAFFAQWLDRPGAPIFDVVWYSKLDRKGLVLELTQVQDGEPFAFDLEVEIELAGGHRVVEQVAITDAEHSFAFATPGRPANVRLDPASKILLWRPEYGPRPDDDYTAALAPPEGVAAAVVGTYRERDGVKEIVVFLRDGALLVQPSGAPAFDLLYEGDGAFRVDAPGGPTVVHFDMTRSPSPFMWANEGGEPSFADRVEP